MSEETLEGRMPRIRLTQKHNPGICPVQLNRRLQHVPKQYTVHAFSHKNGSVVTRLELANTLRKCLQYVGIHGNYNTHSFRIGRAMDMAQAGYSGSQIESLGRWKSNGNSISDQNTLMHHESF